ncbi:MAG: hypothetical protein V9E90_02970 [Saprospiraceae bacterium]
MRSIKPQAHTDSWVDQFESDLNLKPGWLENYRKHLSWIKTSKLDQEDEILKDLATEL